MSRITMDPSQRTPFVDFDFNEGRLAMRGQSYPEDAAAFFGPLHRALAEHLERAAGSRVTLELEMTYFNSSSAKALMNIFQLLEGAARSGVAVAIEWKFAEDDETMQEFGEDFASDFQHASFTLCPLAAS